MTFTLRDNKTGKEIKFESLQDLYRKLKKTVFTPFFLSRDQLLGKMDKIEALRKNDDQMEAEFDPFKCPNCKTLFHVIVKEVDED